MTLPRFYTSSFAGLLLALSLLASPVQGEWSRQLPWRLAESKVVREHAWACERSAGLSLSAYPRVRWRLEVKARRRVTLMYWHARLNVCRAHRESIGNLSAWLCIHHFEGSWSANTGNGYYGGLQMDVSFMRSYGMDMIRRYGGYAHLWSPRDQMVVAERARASGRGYFPWPRSARWCGLI